MNQVVGRDGKIKIVRTLTVQVRDWYGFLASLGMTKVVQHDTATSTHLFVNATLLPHN